MSKLIHPHKTFATESESLIFQRINYAVALAKANGGGVGYRPRVHVHLFQIEFITIAPKLAFENAGKFKLRKTF